MTIYRITEEAEEDGGLLAYLQARGLPTGCARDDPGALGIRPDPLTLDGPLGRATLGLRPAGLIRVLPGEAERSLFHSVPMRDRARADQPARKAAVVA